MLFFSVRLYMTTKLILKIQTWAEFKLYLAFELPFKTMLIIFAMTLTRQLII